MEGNSTGTRIRRIAVAGFEAVAFSFLLLFIPILIYAFVLAFQARGIPDQSAINHFAAAISPAAMPWLERVLTALLAFRLVRRAEGAGAADGLAVGVVSGVLGLAVMFAFGGRISAAGWLSFSILVALGWLGGFVARRMATTADKDGTHA
jgi:hypothetical protein